MESRLGELLLQRNLVARDQLERIGSDQHQDSSLAARLVQARIISDEQLATLLESELGRPRIDPTEAAIAAPIARLIPDVIARRHHLVPIALSGRELTVAMADPTNLAAINEIRLATGYTVRPLVATVSSIATALVRCFPPAPRAATSVSPPRPTIAERAPAETRAGEDAPVIRLIDALLSQAIERRASDLHFEPYEDCMRVRFRVDGLLQEVVRPPVQLKNAAISRLKVMSALDIAERRLPQDGRFRLARGTSHPIDLRISVLPTLHGEKAVLRILDHGRIPLHLEQIGLDDGTLASLRCALRRPNGLVLVTGPTGSGKTTTLYAALNALNDVGRNLCTVEDPVELHVAGVNQVQVNDDIGLSFSATLRALLRQDPDVIMVGEIRDAETAAIAVRAALTGHLVLSTLHTNDSAAAVARLLDMEVPPLLLASALNLVVAQRLVRQRCTDCLAAEAVECGKCGGVRYSGRLPVFEAMTVGIELRRLIQRAASTAELRDCAVAQGMTSLAASAAHLVTRDLTDPAEVARVIQAESD